MPIDSRQRIEGRRVHGGVIRRNLRPSRRKHWPEALYLFVHHSDHTLTTETPTRLEQEKRVQAQWIALATACEALQG